MITTRRTTGLLAAAAVLATAGLTAGPAAQGSTPPVTTTSAATSLPRVGNGWAVVVLAKDSRTTTARPLVLVSPTGRQQRIGTVPAGWAIGDVSNDARRVLLRSTTNGEVHGVLDVTTGRTTVVKGHWLDLRLANPTGYRLIGRQLAPRGSTSGAGWVVRTDLAGNVLTRFANTLGGSAQTHSPDGKYLVNQLDGRLQVNLNSTGRVVRQLPLPKGAQNCFPGHWTSTTQFTASCYPTNGQQGRVYRMSITGSAPVALTASLPNVAPYGYSDAWATPRGTVVVGASECGGSLVGLVEGRSVQRFSLPAGAMPTAVAGSSIWHADGYSCGDADPGSLTLRRYDIATRHNVVLAGGTANPGLTVQSLAMVDTTR